MKYDLPKGYLSASQIGSYLRCGLQYYFRYIEGLVLPPNVAMMTGTACHKGFEIWYEDTIEEGEPSCLTGSQVADLAIAEVETEVEEKHIKLAGEEKDQAVIEIQTAITSYIDTVAPRIKPIAVEKEITFDIVEGIPILAFIDLIRDKAGWEPKQDNDNTNVVVCDYKVTTKKWNINQLVNNLQFMLYSIGTGVDEVEIHNLRKTTGKVKQTKEMTTGWDNPSQDVTTNIRMLRHSFSSEAEKAHTVLIAKKVAEGITKGNFMPCTPDAWCCNEKWCGYWGLCRGG